MTKYILNSGGLSNEPRKAAQFFNEIVKGLSNSPRLLICLFAQPREVWEEKFMKYRQAFADSLPKAVQPTFELAEPERFIKQVKNSEAIIIYGGDDHLVKYWLKQYPLAEIFTGKVVAGSSAGSDVLVKHFWSSDWRQCGDGLGLVPLKFIPHYDSLHNADDPRGPIDWQKAYNDLAAYGDTSLPIQALKEGEFVIIEI